LPHPNARTKRATTAAVLNDLRDYAVLIAGAASLQIEEIDVRVFGSELEASFHAITQPVT
jgi:hypothetical protein